MRRKRNLPLFTGIITYRYNTQTRISTIPPALRFCADSNVMSNKSCITRSKSRPSSQSVALFKLKPNQWNLKRKSRLRNSNRSAWHVTNGKYGRSLFSSVSFIRLDYDCHCVKFVPCMHKTNWKYAQPTGKYEIPTINVTFKKMEDLQCRLT